MNRHRAKNGFTLPELLIVMAIFVSLVGLITISLSQTQKRTSVNAIVGVLLSDMRSQQLKAMMGDTEGRSGSDSYGIYFAQDRHVLFHGMSYNPSDNSNFTVELDPAIEYSPVGKTIVFERISGNVATFSAAENTISVVDTQNSDTKIIQFNKYGAIVSVN